MSSIVVKLPKPLENRLEELARLSGVSIADLLLEAADKMSRIETLELVKKRALRRDNKGAFDRVLAAVPDVPPTHPGDIIK